MSLDVSQSLLNAARLSREAVPLIRIWPGGATEPICLCGGPSRRHDGASYRGLLMELPRGARGFDILTHKPITGNWEILFNNGECATGQRFSDKLAQVQNRDMEIRIWVPGLTTWLSCPIYMRGRIGVPKHDDRQVVLEVEDFNSIMHRKVPGMVGSSDAADEGQGLPEESLGKAKPFIGGDHTFLKGDDAKSKDTASVENNKVPCIYRGVDSDGRHSWLIAGHKVDEILVASDQAQLWGFDSTLNRYVRLAGVDVTVEQNTPAGCIISHPNNPYFFDYWYSKGTVVGSVSGSGTTSNPNNVNDKDYSTCGQLAGNVAAIEGSNQRFDVPFAVYDDQGLPDGDISEIKIFVYGLLAYLGDAGDGDHEIEIGLGESPFGEDQYLSTRYPTGGSFPDARLSIALATSLKADIAQSQRIKLTKQNNDVPKGATFDVYEIYKQIKYTRNSLLPLSFGGRGIEYGPEINGRSTSEGYTESHADDDGEGNAAENGAGLMELIYRKLIERNAEHLAENEPGTAPTKWAKTGSWDWSVSGPTLDYSLTLDLNGTIKQTAANRLLAGRPFVSCRLKYSVAVNVAPDGDFEMFLPAGGLAESKTTLPHTAGIHVVRFITGSGAATADFVIQSSETTAAQGYITVNKIYLEVDELDLDAFNVASNDVAGIKLAPALVNRIESDTVIGEIARQCRLYPWVQPNGTIKVKALEDTYTSEDLVIDLRRARFVKPPEWTPLDWLKTRVKVLYDWNGERYLSQTEFAEDEDQQDYCNVTAEETTKWLECRGIHELASAEAVRDWWLAQWKQLHIRFPLWVPLDYFHIDAGDVASFTQAPYKVFNEDITANHTRSGQTIYKYFLATKVEPWVDGAVVHFFNLHDLSS